MTNTITLPETDRIAESVNPLFETISEFSKDSADALEIGATTVIGLVRESMHDLHQKVRGEAESIGLPAEAADGPFMNIADALDALLQPRLNVLRAAVCEAQGKDSEDDPLQALLDLLTEAVGGPNNLGLPTLV